MRQADVYLSRHYMDFIAADLNYYNHFHGHTNLIENIIQNLWLLPIHKLPWSLRAITNVLLQCMHAPKGEGPELQPSAPQRNFKRYGYGRP